MHDYDHEIAWIADLDWSAHGDASEKYLSDRLFYAKLAKIAGSHVCEPWPLDALLRHASNDHPGRIVGPEHAFQKDGTPITSIHVAVGETMMRHAVRLLVPMVSSDAISFDEWDAVIDAGQSAWDLGIGARRAAAGLGPFLAKLAYDEKIRCWARPVGGGDGEARRLVRADWDIDPDLAIRRLACCGLNLDARYDAAAPLTHRIFVESGGLQNAIIEGTRTTYVATAFLEHGEWAFKRKVDHYAVTKELVAEFLISLMIDENLHWDSRRFEAAVVDEFGARGLGRTYEQARRIATSHPERARFKVRRPNPQG